MKIRIPAGFTGNIQDLIDEAHRHYEESHRNSSDTGDAGTGSSASFAPISSGPQVETTEMPLQSSLIDSVSRLDVNDKSTDSSTSTSVTTTVAQDNVVGNDANSSNECGLFFDPDEFQHVLRDLANFDSGFRAIMMDDSAWIEIMDEEEARNANDNGMNDN